MSGGGGKTVQTYRTQMPEPAVGGPFMGVPPARMHRGAQEDKQVYSRPNNPSKGGDELNLAVAAGLGMMLGSMFGE